jgi:hypothetical protein
MKKSKLFLTCVCTVVIVGGVVAFKAHKRFDSPNIYQWNGSSFVPETSCYYPQESETDCSVINNSGGSYYYFDGTHYDQLPKSGSLQLYALPD